jgi:predicted regulator of Ras-like GTPase activity (Roadblock/LC7/MglB family)
MKERIIAKFIREACNYLRAMVEREPDVEDEKTDFDKIIARYRMAVSKRDAKEIEEKKPSVVADKNVPTELSVKKEEPVLAASKPTQKNIIVGEEAEKILDEKVFEWVKVVESAIQNCISQSKGSISSISVLLPDGITCLSFGSRIDIDEDVLAAFIGEQFELFESYGGVLKIGEIEEIEYTGKQSVILMKSGGGLRLMALLNDKRYVRLAKIYLERMLKSIPRLE